MSAGKKFKEQRNSITKRRDSFFTKMEEYKKLTLDELKVLFNHPDKKQRPGGIYREALIEVVRQKQLEVANIAAAEINKEIAVEQVKGEDIQ